MDVENLVLVKAPLILEEQFTAYGTLLTWLSKVGSQQQGFRCVREYSRGAIAQYTVDGSPKREGQDQS